MNVFIIAAVSLDGMIGRDSGHGADWTSKEDKKLFKELTKQAGVIVMGSKTFKTIGRALPDRRNIVMTRSPDDSYPEGVEPTNEAPEQLLARLEQEGATSVAICGGAEIYYLFMQHQLVDELYITVEPVVFGTGVPLFRNTLNTKLQLSESRQLNKNCVLLHYKVLRA